MHDIVLPQSKTTSYGILKRTLVCVMVVSLRHPWACVEVRHTTSGQYMKRSYVSELHLPGVEHSLACYLSRPNPPSSNRLMVHSEETTRGIDTLTRNYSTTTDTIRLCTKVYVVFFVDLWFEVKMGLEFAVLRQHHHGVVGVSSERDPVKVLWTLLIRFHALVRVKSSLLLAPSP